MTSAALRYAGSPKLTCRMPHSPARWPPYGRPETSRLLKVNHYMLHVRMMMRLGAYASSRQVTDYAGAGGGQELRPRVHDGRSGLPGFGVCIRRIEGLYIWSGPQGPRDPVLRLQSRLRRLEERWSMWLRAKRRIGDSSGVFSRR